MGLELETLHLKGEIVNHSYSAFAVSFYVYGSKLMRYSDWPPESFPAAKGIRVPATGYVEPGGKFPFDIPLGLDGVSRVDIDRYPDLLVSWEISYGPATEV